MKRRRRTPTAALFVAGSLVCFLIASVFAYSSSGLAGRTYVSPGRTIRLLPVREWGFEYHPGCPDIGDRYRWLFVEVDTYHEA